MTNYTFSDILKLNKEFYESNAHDFSLTRAYPWRGWNELLPIISDLDKKNELNVLDLGCGNGRFYGFLLENATKDANNATNFEYLGIDFSEGLIKEAKDKWLNYANEVNKLEKNITIDNKSTVENKTNPVFEVGDFFDLINNLNLNKNGYSLVAGFGIMHHIYQSENQLKFILNCLKIVSPKGYVVLSFWLKIPEENKIIDKIDNKNIILNWDKDTNKKRFVHVYSVDEVKTLINEAVRTFRDLGALGDLGNFKFEVVKEFLQDGKDGSSNFYVVLQRG